MSEAFAREVRDIRIQVMRDDRRPVEFWADCSWSPRDGRHRFEDGKSELMTARMGGPYRYCSRCGDVVAESAMPKGKANANGIPRSGSWKQRIEFCMKRDGAGCFYCGSTSVQRLDHFIPRSRGGPDGVANRRAACIPCDVAKGARMPWEFMPERFAAPVSNA